jgi:hypothetical protein
VAYSNKEREERERINNTPHLSSLPQGERRIRGRKIIQGLPPLIDGGG